ncbi:MAG: acetate--CoA ligase family protein [Rhodospirillales bacterium]
MAATKSTAHPLDSFFKPKSVAVVGASPEATSVRGRALGNLINSGYAGKIYPINPSHEEILGLKVYPSIESLPEPVDVAVIVIPPERVPAALEECAKKGCPNAIILASGFAEGGEQGREINAKATDIIARYPIRVAGPNIQGFFNIADPMALTFSRVVSGIRLRKESKFKHTAIVSQSSGLGFSLLKGRKSLGLEFSHILSTGNEIDLDCLELTDYLIERGNVGAIILFIEGLKDPRRFPAVAAKAADAGIPLIVGKVGRSAAGKRATLSHTAHLAGDDTAYDAVFKRYGVLRANNPDEMLNMAAALTSAPLPSGNRVAISTVSGGNAVWLSDEFEDAGIDVVELSEETQKKVAEVIPYFGSAQNPIDLTAQANYMRGDKTFVGQSIGILVDAPEVDIALLVQNFTDRGQLERQSPEIIEHAKKGKPVLVYSYTEPDPSNVELLTQNGFPCYTSQPGCAHALKALCDYAAFQKRWRGHPPAAAAPGPNAAKAQAFLGKAGKRLNEQQSKDLLRLYDIALPKTAVAASSGEARKIAGQVGFPCAMKVLSADIAHKTEAGGVVLNVGDADAAARAFETITANVKKNAPKATVDGVLIEQMVPAGVEMTAGLINDPDFGPLVMVGLGGIFIEVLKDAAFAPAPLSRQDARDLILSLKGAPVLGGVRGQAPADIDALADILVKLAQLGIDLKDRIEEADLNPVIVSPSGATVADAFIAKNTAKR